MCVYRSFAVGEWRVGENFCVLLVVYATVVIISYSGAGSCASVLGTRRGTVSHLHTSDKLIFLRRFPASDVFGRGRFIRLSGNICLGVIGGKGDRHTMLKRATVHSHFVTQVFVRGDDVKANAISLLNPGSGNARPMRFECNCCASLGPSCSCA